MQGTIVNAAAIIGGSLLGVALKSGIKPEYQKSITQALGVAVGVMGVEMALKSANILIVIISLVIGIILGEMIDIEGKLNRLGEYLAGLLERKSTAGQGENTGNTSSLIGKGFVSASLIFCVGAMAVVGSIQDGLTGDTRILYVKSLLDGIISLVFASTMGIGVIFSAVSVFLYQGSITLLAGVLAPFFSEQVISELTATGGILIVGISILMLELSKIKLANWLPAIPVSIIIAYFWVN
ncbi:MAG: DUF554 domain-containing protein [Sporomusaceae bacterium]|nr:DUF554 domain-containing protein [Sporomusaceae bacterium]